MDSGCIKLEPLYEYVEKDSEALSLYGNSTEGRIYGKLAKACASHISNLHGFYLWGKYEKNGLWRNIYLGKAGYGKTACLRARILEELKDERVFLWANGYNNSQLMLKGESFYPKMWRKYKSHWERAFRKMGTTHIIWVTTPKLDNSSVIRVESDLIETMNPIANMQRPAPSSELQEFTVKIISCFKHHIHLYRNEIR